MNIEELLETMSVSRAAIIEYTDSTGSCAYCGIILMSDITLCSYCNAPIREIEQ